MLTMRTALEYARSGIRINGVAPTFIEAGMMQKHFAARPGLKEELLKDHPIGRLVTEDEVSQTIFFLLSSSSSYINGTNLAIDGGISNMVLRPRYG